MSLTTRIAVWTKGRADCMAREATDGASSRWGEEIQGYDDEATDLLTEATPLIAVAESLAMLDVSMWGDNATAFTCIEADAIAELLQVTRGDQTASDFLRAHAYGDVDEGDLHAHLLEVAR